MTDTPTIDARALDITPIHKAERRKLKWYALVTVRDTGKRLFLTPFCGSCQAAHNKAEAMIADLITRTEAGR